MNNTLYVVVPCYNEQDALPVTANVILKTIRQMVSEGLVSAVSKVLFVDDGSTDKTWSLISSLAAKNKEVEGIKLSHNQGHQNALFAGMMYAKNKCDCLISIDADLQDDIDVMADFVDKFNSGCDVV